MTIAEIEESLANGLHYAEVYRIEVGYEHRTTTLNLAVWMGDFDGPRERREAYKNAELQISDFLFLVMKAPNVDYAFRGSGKLTIDGCDMRKNLDSQLTQSLLPEAFFRSFFVGEWNASIHLARTDAELGWEDEEAVYHI